MVNGYLWDLHVGDQIIPEGNCQRCHYCLLDLLDVLTDQPMSDIYASVCVDCGNSACPRGVYHRDNCIESGEDGL